jgi:hypothetical protein
LTADLQVALRQFPLARLAVILVIDAAGRLGDSLPHPRSFRKQHNQGDHPTTATLTLSGHPN